MLPQSEQQCSPNLAATPLRLRISGHRRTRTYLNRLRPDSEEGEEGGSEVRGKGKHGLLWAVRMSASSRLSDGRQGIQKNMPESVQYFLRKLRDSTRNIELRGARVRFGDYSFGG